MEKQIEIANNIRVNNTSTQKEKEQMVQIYTEGANKNNKICQHFLGFLHYDGNGVDKDYDKALYWFEKAGLINSISSCGIIYVEKLKVSLENAIKGFEYLEKTYKLGDICINHQVTLGILYYTGYGCKQDYEKAFKLFLDLAENGDISAKIFITYCYRNGIGVKPNTKAYNNWKQRILSDNKDDIIEHTISCINYLTMFKDKVNELHMQEKLLLPGGKLYDDAKKEFENLAK